MRSVWCVFNIEAGCRYNVNGDNAISFSAATTSFKNARGKTLHPFFSFSISSKGDGERKKTRQLVSHAIETNCELSISSFISTFRLYVP